MRPEVMPGAPGSGPQRIPGGRWPPGRRRPAGRVLDLGSGNAPHPWASVLCDRLPGDDAERAERAPLQRDARPFVIADGEALPFRTGAFDYVICSHVLEHARDPAALLAEVARVGRRGYIETPSPLSEALFGWPFHRWVVFQEDGVLLLAPRREGRPFGDLFHDLYRRDVFFRLFFRHHPELFFTRLEWEGEVRHRFVESLDWAAAERLGTVIPIRTRRALGLLVREVLRAVGARLRRGVGRGGPRGHRQEGRP